MGKYKYSTVQAPAKSKIVEDRKICDKRSVLVPVHIWVLIRNTVLEYRTSKFILTGGALREAAPLARLSISLKQVHQSTNTGTTR